ncbi:WecB/TagA/CpsF family glycosyltransferase [Pseudarthrobacter chlorophenolicus]|uniref:WecB/TagA/CpsF family glycosyltransferase n=1 Tax=Pseudarthrobacter chlorophenolicus TaxID=85085 RepID=UPI00191016C6|nr:WecB/TagA/CpsF family glycosyltransferase [Pseudarthrobacter chlorophenolicus]
MAVRLANSYCVALAGQDDRYHRLLNDSGVNFPDGAPVAAVMRAVPGRMEGLRKPAGRVRGPSFFEMTLDKGREDSLKHFFLGATPETLFRLESAVKARYPGVQVVGTYAPPFGPLDEDFISECAAATEPASPDVVWVGIGTPKQDFLASELATRTGKVCVGVGAAFDFSAGTVTEAPVWIQNSGFEWLYRLTTEPKRLWRRYLFGNAKFVGLVVRHQTPVLLKQQMRKKAKQGVSR